MKKKERSLGELMNDSPDNWANDEKKSIEELYKSFSHLGESIKSYSIDKDSTNNTPEVISERFYTEYFIMSAILEGFINQDEISFEELNQAIYDYVPKDFLCNNTAKYQNSIIAKMIRLGFIEVKETDDKYMPHFRITEKGVETYQEQIFQNLATSSFFNYQTILLNKKTNKLNSKMIFLTVLMLIVTVCSILVTVLNVVIQ